MSIADKLTFLNTTKQLLKTEINKINNVLDDNSTFRSYPQELFNGYLDILNNGTDTLWNNLEKVSQTGTEAVLEGVETAPMKVELKGNTAQNGEPTPDTPIPVQVVTGNNVVSVIGENVFDFENKVALGNGTNFSGTTEEFTISSNGTYGAYVFILGKLINFAGQTLTLSTNILSNTDLDTALMGFILCDSNGGGRSNLNVVESENGKINLSVAIPINPNKTKYLAVRLYGTGATANSSTEYKQTMVKIGSTITEEYVPYSKTDYPISLGTIEMCKIGNYQDFFFEAKNGDEYYDSLTEEQKNALNYGSWYLHKAIGKVVLDGSESWNERTNAINVKQFYVSNTLPSIINTTQYCNYFAKYNGSNIYNYGAIGNFAILTSTKQFFGCVNSDLTLENFKTLLAGDNLIVYYVLATPTEEEITNTTLIEQLEAIYKAKSVKDKTYITQTNDELPFILDVSAIKEYEVV